MAITHYRKNCLGTVTFDALFKGMRKVQEFDVYPIGKDSNPTKITIQSDTRIGEIRLTDGSVKLTPAISSGAYCHHMMLAKEAPALTAEELLLLKSNIFSTASANAGSLGVVCDNSSAIDVFA